MMRAPLIILRFIRFGAVLLNLEKRVAGFNCMGLIEIILLNYRFKFRRLYWKEEFQLAANGRDERRVLLAAALTEVSGLPIKDFNEAYRVLDAMPTPILHRVFIIYKGKQPPTREFATRNLYAAPEPSAYGVHLGEASEAADKATDTLVARMEQQFGKKEVEEAAEVDRQIVRASKLRGAVPKLDDEDRHPLGGFKAKPTA